MKKILYLFALVFLFNSCADDLTELNVDPKNPQEVPSDALFANATVELFDFMTSCNVNVNNFRLWAQHWAQTTYPDESNYELVERDVNGEAYETFYTEILRDLKEARPIIDADEFLSAEEKTTQNAIIDVMEVVSYTILVDIFGDVPYTAAFGEDVTPAYDDDAAIYDAMISKLQAAIPNLKGDSGMGSSDLIYGGRADAWAKFANSYLLRLAIRIADKDDAKAAKLVSDALAGGVFTSNGDNFQLAYQGTPPNTNPLWESLVQSGRSDFVAANTMVDYLNGLEDPRRGVYYRNQIEVYDSMTMTSSFIWQGGVYGAANGYAGNSQPGNILQEETLPGVVMGYTEVLFLLADAAERNYDVNGSAADFYHAAIENSMAEWGVADMAADYLANPDVAYDTAPGNWKEKIAMQKWIALYNQGFEAWTTYRLYDAPVMNAADGAGTTPPFRYTYPVNEFSLNGDNVTAAGAAIGGDDLMTKVFWDVN